MSRSTEQVEANDVVVAETVTNGIGSKSAQSRAGGSWKQIFLYAVLGFAGMFGYAWWRTHDLGLAWPYMNGQRVFASPLDVNLSSVRAGTQTKVRVSFRNASIGSVCLLGLKTSCVCVNTVEQFPLVLSGGETKEICILLEPPKQVDVPFRVVLGAITSEPTIPASSITITGVTK